MIKYFTVSCCLILALLGCQSQNVETRTLEHALDEHYLLTHFQYLASDELQGRKVGTKANTVAQQYLVQQFKHLSIPPFESSYLHPFTFKWLFTNQVSGNNVIAQIKTSDSNDYIVLTAHFDHIGHNGERIYNGADDNASGTAAVLAIAKQLQQNKQQLNHNFLFVLTDGEESHLKGIKAFIQQQSQYVPRIKLNINLDMLAGSKHSKNLHFMSKKLDLLLNEPELQSFYQHQNYTNFSVIKGFKRQLTIENQRVSWLKASDHFGFYRVGIPIIYYGVGVHENYHTPKDTYENTNHQLLIQSANTVYHQLMLLDQLI